MNLSYNEIMKNENFLSLERFKILTFYEFTLKEKIYN